jgi:hypothetical protein
MSWSFDLSYPSPPPGLSANDRGHWARKAKSTAEVRRAVFALTRRAKVPALEKCRVDVVWVVATKHVRDTDNFPFLLKAIYDGIGSNRGVSARIVDDDSPEYMVKPGATILYEPGCTPHFTVTITDLGNAE